jgi:hypothetical protein
MPCPMLYGSRLRGYVPYARGLWFDPAEWIILWMARKRKLANYLSYSEHCFHIIYYSLYMLIMEVYHDSGCMPDFGRMPDSDQKIWLWSYISTLVALSDFSRRYNFECLSWLRMCIMTPVNECAACLTTSPVKDFVWPNWCLWLIGTTTSNVWVQETM